MTKKMIRFVETNLNIEAHQARAGIGIVLAATERMGAEFCASLYKKLPEAKSLAAEFNRYEFENSCKTSLVGLIEQTPGGRRHVIMHMLKAMHAIGLDNKAIGNFLPTIAEYATRKLRMKNVTHIGDFLGHNMIAETINDNDDQDALAA